MSDTRPLLVAGDHDEPTPLSVVQEQIWHLSQSAPQKSVYNEVVAIHKDGAFDVDALRSAFTEIVRRHQIWRSTFSDVDTVPMQRVHAAPTWPLPLVNLSAMSRPEAEDKAARMAAEEARRPFDLNTGPLIRPLLVRIATDHHRIYLTLHQIIFDCVSLYRVILPELVALYDDLAAGRAPSLTERAIQYADFVTRSREAEHDGDFAERVAYWRQHLDGAPTLELPRDKPRPTHRAFRGHMEPLNIRRTLVDELRALSRDRGATLFQVLASAFAILLQRCTGQEDIVFGTVTDLRQRHELKTMVGNCVTPLVLRADLHADPPFFDVLRRVRTDLLGGLDHVVPFDALVRELKPHHDPGVSPILQAMIVLEPAVVSPDGLWSLHLTDAQPGNGVGNAEYDLMIEMDERPDGGIDGRLAYNSDLFDPESARRMATRWELLLENIVAAPTRAISELPILSDHERRQLVEWNRTDVGHPDDACLHELIAAQAQRTPAAIVSDGRTRLTFVELDERAGRLASRLRQLGVGPDKLVGVCMQRSTDLVVALLGILKAGGAFMPLEPDQPRQRLALMISEARPRVVLTTEEDRHVLPSTSAHILHLNSERDGWMSYPPMVATDCGPDNLAYVLFTSGSTGTPKGVMVEHRSLVNQLVWRNGSFGLTSADRILQKTPLGFDPALSELFCPLLTGASLMLLRPGDHALPERLGEAVRDERTTVLGFVPSMLEEFIAVADPDELGSLRLVTCGGETISPGLVRAFFDRFGPDIELRNMYGPTEAVMSASSWRCDPSNDGPVPIGRPVANTQIYLLDANLNPVPIGAPGELCIGGVQVARGYLNQPELTAERFVANPVRPGERIYRTGDIARHRSDGALEFLGRRDGQIKIRGARIELGEIEAAVARHPDVRQAIATLRGDAAGQQRLVVYVLPARAGSAPSLAELFAFLSDRLPNSMLPSALVVVDSIPLTHNGKVDRGALPDPDWRPVATFQPPRNDTERALGAMVAPLLGLDAVGIDENFFMLGGHSLLLAQLIVRIGDRFGVDVALRSVFEHPTIADLASEIEQLLVAELDAMSDDEAERLAANDTGVPPASSSKVSGA
jgi:amino acid adenylation domain-containing protein